MRFSAARGYSLLFFLSGATGLVYELLWVRLLYQAFGSTLESVTTVVAAYMGGLGLGAWLLGRRGDRHPRPAALYGRLEIAIGVFGLVSPFVLALAHRIYVSTAAALGLGGGALALPRPLAPVPVPVLADGPVAPGAAAGRTLRRLGLGLLGVTAFAALLHEIAWTRVLVMIVGGSTYAFTLVLLVFLLGIGLGSALVARRAAAASETAADAALAQGVTAAGAALLFAFFSLLPRYIIAVFQAQSWGASQRLGALGLAIGGVVLVPAIGMGMTFPLLTDLVAAGGTARGEDVGRAYALNTLGSIAGAVLTGFVLVVALGTDVTLRLGLVVSAAAALALAALAARGVAEGSAQHRSLRTRVLGAGVLASAGLIAALGAPRWSTRLIDLGPAIYAREPMDRAAVATFLGHPGARQLAYREGRNATVSVWESGPGRSLKVNGKADASDHGDMDTEIMLGLAPVAAPYAPEFYRIVRRRLADDGVFCQWVQLYQVPVPVVAGVVRNIRTVFPHVEVWFSSPGDVLIIGSLKPLTYDAAWLARLVGPGGALSGLAREYLAVDAPDQYFGHLLLDSIGVARLVERATIVHRDDRPRLEFVAARRFLDTGTQGVFDSLAAMAGAAPAHDSPLLFARALTARRGDLAAWRYVEAARRQRRFDPFWTVHAAAIRLGAGDTTFADTALARFVPRSADAALLAGLVAAKRGQAERARGLLARALAGGADSAETRAALATLAARDKRWREAAALARAAFTGAPGTLRHPYPRAWLGEALTGVVQAGPAEAADSLLADAVRGRPGWSTLHELRAFAALRVGRCDVAVKEFLLLLDFGIERDDGPDLVMRCRRGLKL